MPETDREKGSRFVAAVFAGVGIVLIYLGTHLVFNEYATMHQWPRANALVLSSELAQKTSMTARNSLVTYYWPVVRLKYSVSGKEYVRPATYAAKSNIRSDWETVVAQLKPGTTHLLPYNPQDPAEIHVGVRWNFANLALAGFLILPGIVLMLVAAVIAISKPSARRETAQRGGPATGQLMM